MNGYRFFAEMPEARKSKSASKAYPFQPFTVGTLREYAGNGVKVNCVAVLVDNRTPSGGFEAIGSVFDWDNSQVASTATTREYLRKRCVRVPEELARKLHPRLFTHLDTFDGEDN